MTWSGVIDPSPGLTNHGTIILTSTGAASYGRSITTESFTLANYGALDLASAETGIDELEGDLINEPSGTMAVTKGLLVNSKVTYDGTLALANGAAVVNDGCNVTNNGSLLLGPSATYTNIRGTLVDGASSLTGVTVLGSGSSSTMTGGSVSGGGTLKLTTLGTLKMGATAKPITSTTLTGTFRTLEFPNAAYKVTYSSSAVRLTTLRPSRARA